MDIVQKKEYWINLCIGIVTLIFLFQKEYKYIRILSHIIY